MSDPTDMSEDEFYDKYQPIDAPSDSIIWEREELFDEHGKCRYPDNQVWTYVDTGEGDAAIAGWHIVNRVGYIITEVPWTVGTEGMSFDPIPDESADDLEDGPNDALGDVDAMNCTYCGDEFAARKGYGTYCSETCSAQADDTDTPNEPAHGGENP